MAVDAIAAASAKIVVVIVVFMIGLMFPSFSSPIET
jgi:hypothetical protein